MINIQLNLPGNEALALRNSVNNGDFNFGHISLHNMESVEVECVPSFEVFESGIPANCSVRITAVPKA